MWVQKSYESIDVTGDNCPYNVMHESEYSMEESSGLGELIRCWEVEEKGPQITDVQGQLLANLSFWENELEAPTPIIECIKDGYKLPLLSLPEQYMRPNHKSAQQNKGFVNEAVSDLLKNQCVHEMKEVPHICSPLSVVMFCTACVYCTVRVR